MRIKGCGSIAVAILVSVSAVFAEDTDADDLNDRWEFEFFGSLQFGGDDDPDRDHLTNEEEFVAQTNPTLVDTDGDGIEDSWEVAKSHDPNNKSVPVIDFRYLAGAAELSLDWQDFYIGVP